MIQSSLFVAFFFEPRQGANAHYRLAAAEFRAMTRAVMTIAG